MSGSTRTLLAALVLASVCGSCTERVQDPWVTGSHYAQERHRSAAQGDELRQRLLTVQQDR